MTSARAWRRLQDPRFVRKHNPIIYIVGNTVHVATARGIVAKGDWPDLLTNAQKVSLLNGLIKGRIPHYHNPLVTEATWRAELVALMDTGKIIPVALMYKGNTAILIHNIERHGGQHPRYADILRDYKRQKGLS